MTVYIVDEMDYNGDYHFLKEEENMTWEDAKLELHERYEKDLMDEFCKSAFPTFDTWFKNGCSLQEKAQKSAKTPVELDRIVAQGPAVICFWSDGSRTFSKIDHCATPINGYDIEKAVALNYCKKFLSKEQRTELYQAMSVADAFYGTRAHASYEMWYFNDDTEPVEIPFKEHKRKKRFC